LELYVLEIEESLKLFKVSKNDYEKFIQSKRMSHHQSSTFFENINQIIGSNDFFNLENEIPHNEWMSYLVFIKDPLNANLLMSDILKNENYYFPRVKQLIQNLCCVQPVAIDCERQWSTASIIDHKLRNKIKSQNFITILFLKGNSMLWGQETKLQMRNPSIIQTNEDDDDDDEDIHEFYESDNENEIVSALKRKEYDFQPFTNSKK
jgi:hypothetical protein